MAMLVRVGMASAVAVLCALFALSSGHAQEGQGGGTPSPQVDRDFRLGPGDVLSIFVWQWPDLSRSAPISPDGRLSYPLIGYVNAAGMTLDQLTGTIEMRLREHVREPQLTVTLDEVHSYRIFVTGEVIRPGMFELPGSTTVVQAIAMAGGFTPFASRDDVMVHGGTVDAPRRIEFDYDAFIDGDSNVNDIVLRPGDTVIVR